MFGIQDAPPAHWKWKSNLHNYHCLVFQRQQPTEVAHSKHYSQPNRPRCCKLATQLIALQLSTASLVDYPNSSTLSNVSWWAQEDLTPWPWVVCAPFAVLANQFCKLWYEQPWALLIHVWQLRRFQSILFLISLFKKHTMIIHILIRITIYYNL